MPFDQDLPSLDLTIAQQSDSRASKVEYNGNFLPRDLSHANQNGIHLRVSSINLLNYGGLQRLACFIPKLRYGHCPEWLLTGWEIIGFINPAAVKGTIFQTKEEQAEGADACFIQVKMPTRSAEQRAADRASLGKGSGMIKAVGKQYILFSGFGKTHSLSYQMRDVSFNPSGAKEGSCQAEKDDRASGSECRRRLAEEGDWPEGDGRQLSSAEDECAEEVEFTANFIVLFYVERGKPTVMFMQTEVSLSTPNGIGALSNPIIKMTGVSFGMRLQILPTIRPGFMLTGSWALGPMSFSVGVQISIEMTVIALPPFLLPLPYGGFYFVVQTTSLYDLVEWGRGITDARRIRKCKPPRDRSPIPAFLKSITFFFEGCIATEKVIFYSLADGTTGSQPPTCDPGMQALLEIEFWGLTGSVSYKAALHPAFTLAVPSTFALCEGEVEMWVERPMDIFINLLEVVSNLFSGGGKAQLLVKAIVAAVKQFFNFINIESISRTYKTSLECGGRRLEEMEDEDQTALDAYPAGGGNVTHTALGSRRQLRGRKLLAMEMKTCFELVILGIDVDLCIGFEGDTLGVSLP